MAVNLEQVILFLIVTYLFVSHVSKLRTPNQLFGSPPSSPRPIPAEIRRIFPQNNQTSKTLPRSTSPPLPPRNTQGGGRSLSDYIQTYNSSSFDQGAPKLAVMAQLHLSGMGDRFLSLVSIFQWALYHRLPFYIQWHGNHSLGRLVRSPYVNWRLNMTQFQGHKVHWNAYTVDHTKRVQFREWLWEQNPRVLFNLSTVPILIIIHLNQAFVSHTLRHHPVVLQDTLDLFQVSSSQSIYGLLFNFLFEPTAYCWSLAPELVSVKNQIQSAMSWGQFVMGIHIRFGDTQMRTQPRYDVTDPAVRHYFRCAEEVEQWLKDLNPTFTPQVNRTRARWFFISDVSSLRLALVRKYGRDKIITATNVKPEHVQDDNKSGDVGFARAFLEWWLFGETHIQVIGESCYSISGALRSRRRVATYMAHWAPKCELTASLTWGQLDKWWFGI